MRLAVIGLGRMGRFYGQSIAALAPAVKLVAVVDPDPRAREEVQRALGVPRAIAEPAAVLDRSTLDAVVIATPTSSHAELVIRAAEAGLHVFCEKPLALWIEQTQAVLAAVEQAGVLLQVGFMRRFDAAYQQARSAIQRGDIGRPLTFKAIGRDPACPSIEYANPAASGGLIVDMGIHDFDLARWLMDSEVERVSAEGSLLACDELRALGDIDNAVINLRFASGALGNVEVSRNATYGYDIRTEVLGSEGTVRIGGSAATQHPEVLRQTHTVQDPPHFIRRFGAAYRAQIEHFVECVRTARQPRVSGADALAAIQIARAATQSLTTGLTCDV